MYQWLNTRSKRRHLADNFEMTTYCGIKLYVTADVHRAPPRRWQSLGKVEYQSLGSSKIIASDLCLTCASKAQPFYFESETGQKFGTPIPRLPADPALYA
jgi:hypothetical protein